MFGGNFVSQFVPRCHLSHTSTYVDWSFIAQLSYFIQNVWMDGGIDIAEDFIGDERTQINVSLGGWYLGLYNDACKLMGKYRMIEIDLWDWDK
jgi:hypothetical protein